MKTRFFPLLLVSFLCLLFGSLAFHSVSYAQADRTIPNDGAEWLAIVESQFVTDTARLQTHREQLDFGGFTTHIVTIDEIATEFGAGVVSPTATKAYLQNAYDTWTVQPTHVVLIGDATLTNTEHIPSFIVDDPRYPTFKPPNDHQYTLLANNDLVPDVAIGRISVRTVPQLNRVIDKTIAHDQAIVNHDEWTRNLIMLSQKRSGAGDFKSDALSFLEQLPSTFNSNGFFMDDYIEVNMDESLAAETLRNDFTRAVNTSHAGIIAHFGLGSLFRWGTPAIHSDNDLHLWENHQFPSVIFDGASLGTTFSYRETTHSEALIRDMNGAAAYWGPSNLIFQQESYFMFVEMANALDAGGEKHLGDAIRRVKENVLQVNYPNHDFVRGYTLLGDPGLLNVGTSVPTQITLDATGANALSTPMPFILAMLFVILTLSFLGQKTDTKSRNRRVSQGGREKKVETC